MEPEGSLPSSQKLATGQGFEANEFFVAIASFEA
jgi:hypothetical protein